MRWREELSMWWKLNLFKPGKIQYPLVRRLNQLRIFVRFTKLKRSAYVEVIFSWLIPKTIIIIKYFLDISNEIYKYITRITPFHYLYTMDVHFVWTVFFLVVVVVLSMIGGGKFSWSLPKYTIITTALTIFFFV